MHTTWQVAGVTLTSRMLLGTAHYPSLQVLSDAVAAYDRVLDGSLTELIHAFLVWRKTGKIAGEGDLPE